MLCSNSCVFFLKLSAKARLVGQARFRTSAALTKPEVRSEARKRCSTGERGHQWGRCLAVVGSGFLGKHV